MANGDRETVIVDRGGSGAGAIVAIIVVLALIGVGYLIFAGNNGSSGTVDVDVPAVSVDVVPDGQ